MKGSRWVSRMLVLMGLLGLLPACGPAPAATGAGKVREAAVAQNASGDEQGTESLAAPCVELVGNPGFEQGTGWVIPTTPRPAGYTTAAAHSGARSMRLGIVPPTADTFSYSATYQAITIPAGAQQPMLSFWYNAHTEETPHDDWQAYNWSGYNPAGVIRGEVVSQSCCGESDWQEMLLLDANYQVLDGGVVLRRLENDGVWKQITYDLSPYRGQTVVLFFNVINDGNAKRTWMFVDDVSVRVCEYVVRFEPPSAQVDRGQTFEMSVRVENIDDLYGFETTIRFDPAILEVVDADAGIPGAQVRPGAFLPPGTQIVVNAADNAAGVIRFAASLIAPLPPLSGSGNLVSISFQAEAAGSTAVTFEALQLVNPHAGVIPTGRQNGQVTVTSTPTQATLVGEVRLEGRTDHSGTVVQLDGGPTAVTSADGRYAFTTAGGPHTLAFSHPAYLAASQAVQAVVGSTVTVPTVTLLGGDVNGDGQVNILDLSAVAANFGSGAPNPPTTDVNGDGQVDILDLVLVGKNFSAPAA